MRRLLRREDFDDSVEAVTRRWGTLEHAPERPGETARFTLFPSGGPAGGPFARMRILPGDWQRWTNGQRCELGRLERRYGSRGGAGTFFLYDEGYETTTEWWTRLGTAFEPWPYDLTRDDSWRWPGGAQWKGGWPFSTNPPDPTNTGVTASMSNIGRRFAVDVMWEEPKIVFDNPPALTWFKQSHRVHHSVHEDRGWWEATFDGRAYPRLRKRNLWAEGSRSRYEPGEPVQSTFRIGPYADPSITVPIVMDVARVRIYGHNRRAKRGGRQ